MKAVNFALIALAGLGFVTSQVAFADTLPAAALPAANRLHPVKLVRLVQKRHGAGSDVVSATGLVLIAGGLGAVGLGVYQVSKSSNGT